MEENSIQQSFDCIECGQSFATAEELSQHERQFPPSHLADSLRLIGIGQN